MEQIQITAEPQDNHRCTFMCSVPLLESGVRRFSPGSEEADSPLAAALFTVPGVTEIVVSGPSVTVTKADSAPWPPTARAIGAAIRRVLAEGGPVVSPRLTGAAAQADDALFDKIAMIFDTRINPMVAGHGGHVDLIDIQDQVVLLRMQGGCQGCGMASVTLRQGIESTLRQLAPEVRGIVDVTDHSAGTNPYFAASKK